MYQPERVRVVFGNEPNIGRRRPVASDAESLSREVRDYWLERGVSITHTLHVLNTIKALDSGRLEVRIARRYPGLHAKLFVGEHAATVGSSNFTYPGLVGQLDHAKREYSLPALTKNDSGDVMRKLELARARGPAGASPELGAHLPAWITDREAHDAACAHEQALYQQLARLCQRLSPGREAEKASHLRRVLREHDLAIAFDTRPITLAVMQQLVAEDGLPVLVATGAQPAEQRRVQQAFAPGSRTPSALALCSNSMSEGINLQRASAIVHLDMPSVVRIAEQRVGRIDRMDSVHDNIESWWPKDAPEFALSSDEKLDERLDLVSEILGSNISLPTASPPAIVEPEDLLAEMDRAQRDQLELLDDAFSPVRAFVQGERSLVDEAAYNAMRGSKARVVSAVAVVQADCDWGFFAIPGTKRSTPRWVFVEGSEGRLWTALDDVAEQLRRRLSDARDTQLDLHAAEVMETLAEHIERNAAALLPRRKQRALEQLRTVLAQYERVAARAGADERHALVSTLLLFASPDGRADLDELAEAWLAAIRPRWRKALETPGRRRGRLRRLAHLNADLLRDPIPDQILQSIVDEATTAPPLAHRVVAAIIGVRRIPPM